MKYIGVIIPHSHTWFWTQSCVASLVRNPPKAKGFEAYTVVIDNSPWSPSIRGISDTDLARHVVIAPNHKTNKFHASALDCAVQYYQFDYLMALETDVIVTRPDWLQWFVDQMKPTDFAVGMWHHEQFINPSCTLYQAQPLYDMYKWCRNHPNPYLLRWGPNFSKTAALDNNLNLSENPAAVLKDIKEWIGGPFAEKRGWPEGTVLKEHPSGQMKGPGWYEPGQQLHHWAVNEGYTYTVCPTLTTYREPGLPIQTLYGATMPNPMRQLEAVELFGNAYTAHLWGGTRALDIIKHDVTCPFVRSNTPYWLAREARFWKQIVPEDVQERTIKLIRKYGWYYRGQGSDRVTERDKAAAEYVRQLYKGDGSGVDWQDMP